MIKYTCNIWKRKAFKISAQIQINITKEKLWKIITEPGHLKNYHPFCDYHQKSDWNGVGSKDTSKSYAGKIINREIIEWDEGQSYRIKMDNLDKHDTKVKFEIIEINKKTLIKISLETNAYRKTPRLIWYPVSIFLLKPSYIKYFNSLLRGLKYFSETGNKVARNQFGNHLKYSP